MGAFCLVFLIGATIMPIVVRRSNRPLFKALDEPNVSELTADELTQIRESLLWQPWRAALANAISWIFIMPNLLYGGMCLFGDHRNSWFEIETACCLVSPLAGVSIMLSHNRILQPVIQRFFPGGSLEQYRSCWWAITEQHKLILILAVFGPYSILLMALAAFKVLLSSKNVHEAIIQLLRTEAFVLVALVVLAIILIYLSRSTEEKLFDENADGEYEADDTALSAQSLGIAARKNLVGTEIAQKYQLSNLLGKGGMSTVYLAHTKKGEETAIKVMNSSLLSDQGALARFKREAKTSTSLVHERIVSTFDFGITHDEAPYLVMERIEGKSLEQIMKTDLIESRRAVYLMQQVAEALEHAHRMNVVHRDIKPSNIMVLIDKNEREAVKIVDFGIAKVLQEGPDFTKLTQTGQIFGTPRYMSPEQCSAAKVDQRADIYAFGCVFYELLYGKPPFDSNDNLHLLYQHVHGEISFPALPQHFDASTADLSLRFLQKLLEKDPDRRFQNFSEALEQLNTIASMLVQLPQIER